MTRGYIISLYPYTVSEVTMDENKTESKEDILKRLRRIEGQVKGIQKMIEEDKSCADILTQVAAVRAAINKAGSLILEKHSIACIENAASSEDRKQVLSNLTRIMQSFMRFVD
jgi:DNA-binding FrmR family transcriptional regulator